LREEPHASVTSAKNDEIQAPVALSRKYRPAAMLRRMCGPQSRCEILNK